MTDIVERLRDEEYRGAFQHLRDWSQLDRLHDEAADTIEALQARVRKLEKTINKWDEDSLSDEARYSAALDCIRALEEALRPFAEAEPTNVFSVDEDGEPIGTTFTENQFRRARDVLKGEG